MQKFMSMKRICSFAAAMMLGITLQAQTVVNVDAGQRGVTISSTQYGLFFEEINHAGEGGLYAELIRNRGFREGTAFWTAKGGATMTLNETDVMNEAQTQCMQVKFKGSASGIVNAGYWGMGFEEGKTYRLSLWCKAVGTYTGQLKASLLNSSGTAIGTATIEGDITSEWKCFTAEITATATAPAGKFQLTGTAAGTVLVDVVSLFPPTFKGRENGCREDLAQMLADCKPAFLRFPGGCVVEGNGTIDNQQRFEWKKTIGPIEQRPGHFNNNWGYDLTDGLGFLEYLELCEDLGAAPLFVCNIGLGHGYATGYGKDDLQEVIDEVLDAIEYANGDASTRYGAMRIRDGHPAPFNLRMIEIGNENNQDENARLQSDHYYTRYRIFREAILDKYPGMYLIGNVAAWGTDTPGWWGTDVEAVDEHYYRSPDWFASKFRMYDNYQRGTHKVYVGEYAVTQDFGTTGTLKAALGEAIYMMGAERNADVVNMMSYAPIFVNENHDRPWLPDMIRFNASKSFGTPSYHVQRMFATSTGRQNVVQTIVDQGEGTATGTVGIGTWATAARFTNPQLTTTVPGASVPGFSVAVNWTPTGGTWQTDDAAFTQTSTTATPALLTYSLPIDARRYTFTVRATKTAGAEGFLIPVGYTDAQNFIWWNLGGWGNTASGIEKSVNGVKSLIESKPFVVETGREYTLAVEYNGTHLRLSIDGEVLHDIELRPIYTVASIDDAAGKLYVKMVNYGDTPCPLTIALSHTRATAASIEVLTSAKATDENTMAQPRKVYPQTSTLSVNDDSTIAYDLPAYALAIVTIDVNDTQIQTDEKRVEAARQQLQSVKAVRYLHNGITLPTDLSYGLVEWTLNETVSGYVSIEGNRLSVLQRDAQPVTVATLQGHMTIDGQTYDVFPEPMAVTVAPDDNAVGYLYCHMPDRVPESGGKFLVSQTITYALGTAEDKGLVFHELNHGQSIIPGIGTSLPWCRDAYLCKDPARSCYYIVTTDLYGSRDGGTSMLENYSIGMFRSFDLIHWTYSRCDLKKYLTQNPPTDIYDNSGKKRLTAAKVSRVWAPQVILINGTPYIYYAVGNTDNGDCDHFYISRANADFTGIESFQLLYGPNKRDNILDADIVFNHADGLYHMSYRDYEAADIRDITCTDLLNPVWSSEAVTTFTDGSGFEASSVFRRINDDVWNVGNVNYGNRRGFHFHTADGLLRNLKPAADLSGNLSPQHGSFVMVSQDEWDVVQTWSDLKGIIDNGKLIIDNWTGAEEKIANLRSALVKADTDLAEDKGAGTDLAALAATLKADLAAIQNELAHAAFQLSPSEITALAGDGSPVTTIKNPSFANGASNWTATPAPGTANGVAEFFAADATDYTANIQQTVTGLTEGNYLVTCQAFERNGYNDGHGWGYNSGSERINYHLFANTDTADVCSMYAHRFSGGNSLNGYVNGMESANAIFTADAENYLCGVITKVGNDGKLTLGITRDRRTVHTTDWCCFDNFRVYRLADNLTAVKDILTPNTNNTHIGNHTFTLSGIRTDKLSHGINIVCFADGTVRKVIK